MDKIHVQAPSAVVFVCGGKYSDVSDPTPLSLRGAFLKIIDNPALRGRTIIQAEDITKVGVFADYYRDVLQFETDLAQITELIILFCESEGSLAELGAFCVIEEIATRLLVVVRDRHWEDDSFVKLGPLRFLEREHGRASVFVIDDDDVGMRGNSAAAVNISTLKDRLQEPLRLRLERRREPTTFNESRAGHVTKLVVGLIQEYGALHIDEIDELLLQVGVYKTTEEIKACLLCAESVGWIVKKRKGMDELFIAKALPDAATITTSNAREVVNKIRRRLLIREHWKAIDPLRYRNIIENAGAYIA